MLRFLSLIAAVVVTACGSSSTPADADTGTPPPAVATKCEAYAGPALATLKDFEGTMHEHSSYSDGDIRSVPRDYFRTIRDAGYDYVGSSEHSDSLDTGVFISLGNDCFTTPDGLLTCLTPTADELVKWLSTGRQVEEESSEDFLAIRGFEWTSDRFGHINVYFSRNFSNAKTDLGYLVTMETFWQWFARDPDAIGLGGSATAPVPFGGGGDGLAHFNHPSDKCFSAGDPGCNWNDYALVPSALERLFGMEVYNDGNREDRYFNDYVRALDKGWRLAPIGSEDEHALNYGSEERPKTVTQAVSLNEEGFREAWLARRTYALSPGRHLRAELDAAGHPMGARLSCDPDSEVPLRVRLREADGRAFVGELRLYASGGEELLSVRGDTLSASLPVTDTERWYFVRAHDADGRSAAYLAPIWISPRKSE